MSQGDKESESVVEGVAGVCSEKSVCRHLSLYQLSLTFLECGVMS